MITNRVRMAGAFRYVVAFTAALLMFIPMAHAGLLDFLFGHQTTATDQPVASPAPVGEHARPRLGGPASAPRRSTGASQPHRVVALCCKDGGDPMVALMSDSTLRHGDAVMIPQGMAIFEGATATRLHHSEDFVAIENATSLPLKNRARIAAVIENVQPFPNYTRSPARPIAAVDLTAPQIADR